MPYSAADFAAESDVSRETFVDFQHWHALLVKWNAKINLVSKGAIDAFWQRHALDSWQICRSLPHRPDLSVLDLGSGAGFPGLALAIALKQQGNGADRGHVTLVESAGKKTNFLRTVIRELDLPAIATSERAETLTPAPYDVISARAFAPLPRLLTYAHPFWSEATIGLFLKGQDAAHELTDAQKDWIFDVENIPSRSDPDGILLKLTKLRPKPA